MLNNLKPIQMYDKDRKPDRRSTKIEYLLPMSLGSLKNTKALDNALKYGNTVHVKPKDYYNRYKNTGGLIITKNSIIYQNLAVLGRLDDLIIYDEYYVGDECKNDT